MQIFVLEYSAEEAYAPFYGINKIYIKEKTVKRKKNQ